MMKSSHDAPAQPPLISVVVATYSGDSFPLLREALESILAQTHSNLELIVVLDGPITPESRGYLEELSATDTRVRIESLPVNRGPAAARNAGFRAARGQYIAVFDADDRAVPQRLERQLLFLNQSGADLIGSFMTYIDNKGRTMNRKDMPVTHKAVFRSALFINPINNPTAFAPAAIFQENLYDERFRKGEDYHLWARLLAQGKRLGNVPEYLHELRLGESFLSRRYGWTWFSICLRSQFIVVRAHHPLLWPPLALCALAASSLRLLPPAALAPLYALRNRWRAQNAGANDTHSPIGTD